jgi:hypothetical protein
MVGMNSRSEQGKTDDSSVPRPKWTEEIDLQTVDAAGRVRHVAIYLGDPSTALIALLDARSRTEFSGTDYLDDQRASISSWNARHPRNQI